MINKITVLTTSPSLDINKNVSGIAKMTRLWVQYNDEVNYIVFIVGKKDGVNRNIRWLFNQLHIIINYFFKLLNNKDINIIHINMPLEILAIYREFCFVIIGKLFKKKIIVHLRGGKFNLKREQRQHIKIPIKYLLDKASKIIVLGEREQSFFSKNYKINKSKILILPNAVKINRRKQVILKDEINKKQELRILFIGRLDKNKGLLELVKSLSAIKFKFKLNIAGEGIDKEWFLNLCEKELKNRYEYFGIVSGKEKENIFVNSDIFLLPSYFEGLPNALLEAMSFGVVPIVTPVGSIQDVILNNHNGLVVSVGNHNEITLALKRLNSDPLFYAELSNNAIVTISKKFSLREYLIKINKLYNSIMAS